MQSVKARFAEVVSSAHSYRGDDTLIVPREQLHEIAEFLRDDPAAQMNLLVDLTAVDYSTFGQGTSSAFFSSSGVGVRPQMQIPDDDPWPGPPEGGRFAVVYHFFSTAHKHRLRLVAPVQEDEAQIDTVSDLWPGANWLEREVWDMFGVEFAGHPDLKRILMYEEFEGHPLRKDYRVNKRQPLIGPVN